MQLFKAIVAQLVSICASVTPPTSDLTYSAYCWRFGMGNKGGSCAFMMDRVELPIISRFSFVLDVLTVRPNYPLSK